MLATLCVTSSLALFTLDGSNWTGGFHLGMLSFGRHLGNCWAHCAYGCHIPRYRGHVIRGAGWHVNSFLLCLFTTLAKPYHFASSVVIPQGYKACSRSCTQPTSSRTISPPPSLWLKIEREHPPSSSGEVVATSYHGWSPRSKDIYCSCHRGPS
jgi:hypothetical protein